MKLLKQRIVAKMLDVGPKAIVTWVRDGKFPGPIILPNGDKRWVESDVIAWLESLRSPPPETVASE